jgi:hypothetical protein
MIVHESPYREAAERDVPQLVAEMRRSGLVVVEPGVEQDVPQLLSELIAGGDVLPDGSPSSPPTDRPAGRPVQVTRIVMAWQRMRL